MRALVLGLGSMGKRRIRCLRALGVSDISGFDLRADRCEEAKGLYGIDIAPTPTTKNLALFDCVIISVPPDSHTPYMSQCNEARRSYFVEASVLAEGLLDIDQAARANKIVAAPSATLLFHPAIKLISDLVQSGTLGKISSFQYHSGQYLPDWHPYENVADYYVSNPSTGGAREIVPFELSWLVRCFGWPQSVYGGAYKTCAIPGAPKIDDTYSLLLEFNGFIGTLIVDVVSRFASRKMTITGTEKHLLWDWNENLVRIWDPLNQSWAVLTYDTGQAHTGYNSNIGEQMYVDEISNFLSACAGEEKFANSLGEDVKTLEILYAAERSGTSGQRQML